MKLTSALCLIALLLVGCQNPYVAGYTGERVVPLADDAAVSVVGVNRADPVAWQFFNRELDTTRDRYRLLGSSTIVSGSQLRDSVAAEAGRELGASRVYYSFAYLDSTVERQTEETYHRGSSSAYDRFERRTYDTTRHWYEYRAYFFADAPPEASPEVPPEASPETRQDTPVPPGVDNDTGVDR